MIQENQRSPQLQPTLSALSRSDTMRNISLSKRVDVLHFFFFADKYHLKHLTTLFKLLTLWSAYKRTETMINPPMYT